MPTLQLPVHGKVRRSGMVVRNALVFVFDLDLVEHVFKLTDHCHISYIRMKSASVKFFLSSVIGLLYWLTGMVPKLILPVSGYFRIDELIFWHGELYLLEVCGLRLMLEF